MNKKIVRLVSGVILTSMVFMGCSNKKIDKTDGYIATEDMEYVKSINESDKSDEKIYTLFYGKVITDNDNLSVLKTVFADEYNYENGYQPGACFIDTEDSVELSLGDFVVLEIEQDLNSSDWTGFVLIKGPMSEDEFKKYVEEEIKRKEEMEEEMALEEEVEELEEDNEIDEDDITVGERLNDNRGRGSEDDRLYITMSDRSLWFVPELSQTFFKINYKHMLREITVDSKDELGTIRGTFDAEVVLAGENKIVIAIKPSDKYEYYCLKVDKQYLIGDKFKVTMDTDTKFYMEK